MEAALQQVLTPQALLSSATTDVGLYFALHGLRLETNRPLQLPFQGASPLGGDPIKAVFHVRVESVTPETVSLATETAYDAASLAASTTAALQRMGMPTTQQAAAIEVLDRGTFLFDRTSGLMREVVIDRRITAAGQPARTDHWAFQLVAAPAP
jgi:hypothetical protein